MDLKSALQAIAPAIQPAPKPKLGPGQRPKPPEAPAKPAYQPRPKRQAGPRRVPMCTFEHGRVEALYGSKGAHSESREPPKHDDVFPERFFTGNYTNQPRWYPYVIHKTMKATP